MKRYWAACRKCYRVTSEDCLTDGVCGPCRGNQPAVKEVKFRIVRSVPFVAAIPLAVWFVVTIVLFVLCAKGVICHV